MRIDHTMIRVKNLEKSIAFYQNMLGMQVFKQKDYPHGEFTLAFLGYNEKEHLIELTYNWDNREYDLGTGYGHIAIVVDDIYKICEAIREKQGKITREPGPMKGSTSHIAFVQDPDGYKIELIQKG